MVLRESACACILVVGLLLIAAIQLTGGISSAASPFPKTAYGNPWPYQGSEPLLNFRRAVERAAVQYARSGMENPLAYDRAYRRYEHAKNWYYSDAGPGGRVLQNWLRRQSIYSGSSGLSKPGSLRRTPGL